MKARKLDLSNYAVQAVDGQGKSATAEYNVRSVLPGIMLHPQQNLKGPEFFSVGLIGRKIEEASDSYVFLSEEEYRVVKKSIDTFQGFGKHDFEMVRRVYECPIVKMEEEGSSPGSTGFREVNN